MDHPQFDQPPADRREAPHGSAPTTGPVDGCRTPRTAEPIEAETGLLLAWIEGRLEPLPERLRARLVAEGEALVRRRGPFGGRDLG